MPVRAVCKPHSPDLTKRRSIATDTRGCSLWHSLLERPPPVPASRVRDPLGELVRTRVGGGYTNGQQTLPHPIMHSAADYSSWFSPKLPSSFCSWVCLSSDRVLTTNEPLQGSLECVKRPPLHGGLGTLVWSAICAHPSAIAAFS